MNKSKNPSEFPFIPCGLEISRDTVLMALGEAVRSFDNNPAGHQALLRCIEQAGGASRLRVCMEATGRYGLDLALALDRAGIPLMVANPRATHHFALSEMRRSKTDPVDARGLREYVRQKPFQRWQPPSPAALNLLVTARRLEDLTETITAEKNRRHATSVSLALPRYVLLDIERTLRHLQRSVERLTRAAESYIHDDPVLTERYHLLQSIPGIGRTSAVHILAELSLLPAELNIRQWVAAAGLDPQHCDSGVSVHRPARISKMGNAHLRRALYMPALVAIRRQPRFRAFYLHLLERGKAKMQALVAAMRKLLHAIYGMFHHHQTFDESKVYAFAALPSNSPVDAVA